MIKYLFIILIYILFSNFNFVSRVYGYTNSTWLRLQSGTAVDITDIQFITETKGILIGKSGMVKITNSGGLYWININSGVYNNLNSVFCADENTFFIVGDSGLILRSNNGGIAWDILTDKLPVYDRDYDFNDVYFLSPDKGWIVGDKSVIYYTEDNGNTWQKQFEGDYDLNKIYMLANGSGMACGNNINIKTDNFGADWQPYLHNLVISDIKYNSEKEEFTTLSVNDEYKGIFKITGFGSNYVKRELTDYKLYSVDNRNSQEIWSAGESGKIMISRDGGSDWFYTESPTIENINKLFFWNTYTGWIGCDNGVLYKYTYNTQNDSYPSEVSTIIADTIIHTTVNDTVTLDGSHSLIPNYYASKFLWQIEDNDNKNCIIENSDSIVAKFVSSVPGLFKIKFNITDEYNVTKSNYLIIIVNSDKISMDTIVKTIEVTNDITSKEIGISVDSGILNMRFNNLYNITCNFNFNFNNYNGIDTKLFFITKPDFNYKYDEYKFTYFDIFGQYLFNYELFDTMSTLLSENQSFLNNISLEYNIPAGIENFDTIKFAVFNFNYKTNEWLKVSQDYKYLKQTGLKIKTVLNHLSMYVLFPLTDVNAEVENMDNIVIYPNPFRPLDNNPLTGLDYTGLDNGTGIYFKNVLPATKITIVNLNGSIILEDKVDPGKYYYQWNVKNKTGNKINSGIYLVYFKNNDIKIIKKVFIVR